MATLEERVAYLEGKVNEQSQAFSAIRDAIGRLEQRVDARFDAVDRRFEAIDHRFGTFDQRFDGVDRRLDAIDRHFVWMVGIQITSVLALVGVLFSQR